LKYSTLGENRQGGGVAFFNIVVIPIQVPRKTTSKRVGADRGTSPAVAKVIKSLISPLHFSQAGLARSAGVNRGVLNQLQHAKTNSTPHLIGRLLNALSEVEAAALLEAFVEDTLRETHLVQTSAPRARDLRPITITVKYPPQSHGT